MLIYRRQQRTTTNKAGSGARLLYPRIQLREVRPLARLPGRNPAPTPSLFWSPGKSIGVASLGLAGTKARPHQLKSLPKPIGLYAA